MPFYSPWPQIFRKYLEIKAIIAKTKPFYSPWISTAQSVGDLIGLIVGQEFRDYKLLKYLGNIGGHGE